MSHKGVSILEVLVVLAVLAILFGIGAAAIPRDHIEVNQAAERFQRDVERARFSAVSANATIDFTVDGDANRYDAVVRNAVIGTQNTWAFAVDLATSGFPNAEVDVSFQSEELGAGDPGLWAFDARGVAISATGVREVVFSHARSGYERVLVVNRYGKVRQ